MPPLSLSACLGQGGGEEAPAALDQGAEPGCSLGAKIRLCRGAAGAGGGWGDVVPAAGTPLPAALSLRPSGLARVIYPVTAPYPDGENSNSGQGS